MVVSSRQPWRCHINRYRGDIADQNRMFLIYPIHLMWINPVNRDWDDNRALERIKSLYQASFDDADPTQVIRGTIYKSARLICIDPPADTDVICSAFEELEYPASKLRVFAGFSIVLKDEVITFVN